MTNMLCQLCHCRQATVTCTQAINKTRHEIHLCAECAEQEGYAPAQPEPDLFDEVIPQSVDEEDTFFDSDETGADRHCLRCGTSREEFERTGLLGCELCYATFADDLRILMRRLHGATHHIGRRPRPSRVFSTPCNVLELRQELQRAIAEERFERAAELRDLLQQCQRQKPDTEAEK